MHHQSPLKLNLFILGLFISLASLVQAQGWIIIPPQPGPPPLPSPRPPVQEAPFIWKSYEVHAELHGPAAQVHAEQVILNPNRDRAIEARFIFPLPTGSAVDQFTLTCNGQELPGRLLKSDDARRIYESIARQAKDPALLEYIGQDLLQSSVFPIPAGKDARLSLRFTQTLSPRPGGLEFNYPLTVSQRQTRPIEQVSITVESTTPLPAEQIYSPSHAVQIDQTPEGKTRIHWSTEQAQQLQDFRLIMGDATNAAEIQTMLFSYWPEGSDRGYFMLHIAPPTSDGEAPRVEKDVVLVLDRSGSMQGRKIDQAREAARFVLNHLEPGDRFNLLSYDDRIDTLAPALLPFDDATLGKGQQFVSGIDSRGSTNIDSALHEALGLFGETSRPGYLLFLTDGLPTAGETNEMKIAANAVRANRHGTHLFSFGVGYDVNARLLDRLSREQSGASVFVKPDEDIETAVADFYRRMSRPVLTDVALQIPDAQTDACYPAPLPDLFEGQPLLYIGTYREPGKHTLTLSGYDTNGKRERSETLSFASRGENHNDAFVEKIWASRRIGELLDLIDLEGRQREWVEELTALSQRHGIMTPYTSFLADEQVTISSAEAFASNVDAGFDNVSSLNETTGRSGQAQRAYKLSMKNAEQAPALRAFKVVDVEGNTKDVDTLRQIDERTYYRKNGVWTDATLNEDEIAQATPLTMFSEEYFALLANLSPAERSQLNFVEPALVRLAGKVYRLEPQE